MDELEVREALMQWKRNGVKQGTKPRRRRATSSLKTRKTLRLIPCRSGGHVARVGQSSERLVLLALPSDSYVTTC